MIYGGMPYGLDAESRCMNCGETIEDRLFDHKDDCFVGRDERNLFAHDEIVMCLQEFEKAMGPCPIHGKPDFVGAMMNLDKWKTLLILAKNLCSEGIHQTMMRGNWTEACKTLIREVEEIENATRE